MAFSSARLMRPDILFESNEGRDTMARKKPVFASIATTAPARPGNAVSAARWSFSSTESTRLLPGVAGTRRSFSGMSASCVSLSSSRPFASTAMFCLPSAPRRSRSQRRSSPRRPMV